VTEIEKRTLKTGIARQVGIAGLTLLASLLFVSFGLMMRFAIDHPESVASLAGLVAFCAGFLAIRLAMPCSFALVEWLSHGYCIRVESLLRAAYLDKLGRIYLEQLEQLNRSEMVATYEAAMSSVSAYIRVIWGEALPILFQTVFVIGCVSFYFDGVIAGSFTLVVATYMAVVIKMTSARFPLIKRVAITQKYLNGVLHSVIAAGLCEKLFNAGGRLKHRHGVAVDRYLSAQQRVRQVFFRFGIVTTLVSFTGSAMVLAGAAFRFNQGYATMGSLIMLATFLFQVFLPLNRIGVLWRTLNKARIDFVVLEESLGRMAMHAAAVHHDQPADPASIDISLHQLCKSKGGRPILQGVTANVPCKAGLPTFVTGTNGTGKTTLARLIAGVDRPDSGCIRFNGVTRQPERYGLTPDWIAMTSQTMVFIGGTVAENLETFLGPVDLDAYAVLASTLSFDKPLAYEVGEQGQNLSAGERQKLGIILALLKKPALLVMDEPTTHLDPASVTGLQRLVEQKALISRVLIVTHDSHFMRHFDCAPRFGLTQGTRTTDAEKLI
jgi:ATP-binding cassette subfamily B protein